MKKIDLHHSHNVYKTDEGKTSIEVKLERETVWLNQYQFETLFQTDKTSIKQKNLMKIELVQKCTSSKRRKKNCKKNHKFRCNNFCWI